MRVPRGVMLCLVLAACTGPGESLGEPVLDWTCPTGRRIVVHEMTDAVVDLGGDGICSFEAAPGESLLVDDDGDVVFVYGAAAMALGVDVTVELGPSVSIEVEGLSARMGDGEVFGRLTTAEGSWDLELVGEGAGLTSSSEFSSTVVEGPLRYGFNEGGFLTGTSPSTTMSIETFGDSYGTRFSSEGEVAIVGSAHQEFSCLAPGSRASYMDNFDALVVTTSCESDGTVHGNGFMSWNVSGVIHWEASGDNIPKLVGDLSSSEGAASLTIDHGYPAAYDDLDPSMGLQLTADGELAFAATGPLAFLIEDQRPVDVEVGSLGADPPTSGSFFWSPDPGSHIELGGPGLLTWPGSGDLEIQSTSLEAVRVVLPEEPLTGVLISGAGEVTYEGTADHLGLSAGVEAWVTANAAGSAEISSPELNIVGSLTGDLAMTTEADDFTLGATDLEVEGDATLTLPGSALLVFNDTDLRLKVGASEDLLADSTWTVSAMTGGPFEVVELAPRDDVDVHLILAAGVYALECAGPCPALPDGVIAGPGPDVVLAPVEGWTGSLSITSP